MHAHAQAHAHAQQHMRARRHGGLMVPASHCVVLRATYSCTGRAGPLHRVAHVAICTCEHSCGSTSGFEFECQLGSFVRDVARAYRMAPLRLFGIDATCHCIDRCLFVAAKRCSRLRPRPFGSGAVDTVRWLDGGHPNCPHVPSHVSECGAHRRHPAVALAVSQVLCRMLRGATSNVWSLLHVALLLCCMLRVGCCRGLDEYVRCMLQRCMLQPSAQL